MSADGDAVMQARARVQNAQDALRTAHRTLVLATRAAVDAATALARAIDDARDAITEEAV